MLHRPALGWQWRERWPLCGSLFYLWGDKSGYSLPSPLGEGLGVRLFFHLSPIHFPLPYDIIIGAHLIYKVVFA